MVFIAAISPAYAASDRKNSNLQRRDLRRTAYLAHGTANPDLTFRFIPCISLNMPKITPKRAEEISRATGLPFATVRRSRLAGQQEELEAALTALETTIRNLAARVRAYKTARQCERSPARKLEWRVEEQMIRDKLARARIRRFHMRNDLESVKSRIAAKAALDEPRVALDVPNEFVIPASIAPDPDDVNDKLRKLFNV